VSVAKGVSFSKTRGISGIRERMADARQYNAAKSFDDLWQLSISSMHDEDNNKIIIRSNK
jgi:hypothetical protein